MSKSREIEIAEKVKNASIEAARDAFREASMSGLCSDGSCNRGYSVAGFGAVGGWNNKQK